MNRGLFDVSGRTAVVTGASGGLGGQFVRVLHASGCRVAALGRRRDALHTLGKELPGIVTFECDIADEQQVASVIDAITTRLGDIDILVNNAGFSTVGPAEYSSVDEFRRQVETNIVGTFAMCRFVAPTMLRRERGSIINIASIYAERAALTPMAAYCASKGGIANLTRELATQWGGRGVRVNAIAPAYFPTRATEKVFDNPELLTKIEERVPQKRTGELTDLDGPLLFLASDASSYVNGHLLAVDGGWTAL